MVVQDAQFKSVAATSGWVIFCGTITLIAAAANLLFGIVLLVNDEWVAITTEGLIRFDTTTIGVAFLLFAAVQTLMHWGYSMAISGLGSSESSAPPLAFCPRWRSCPFIRHGPGW